MNEAIWLKSANPETLVRAAWQRKGRGVTARMAKLIACGFARTWQRHAAAPILYGLIEGAEAQADLPVTDPGWFAVRDMLCGNFAADVPPAGRDAMLALRTAFGRWPHGILGLLQDRVCRCDREHAAVIRDVIGNPYRRVRFDHRWRSKKAVAVARQMYDARDFTAMPTLADALQDAGCEYADLLDHCRDSMLGHSRGCWAVDRVLGLR